LRPPRARDEARRSLPRQGSDGARSLSACTRMPSLQDIASCIAGYDPKALPVAQAQEFIARLVPRVEAVESVPIRSAPGRVLGRDIVSPINVPAHDNSAMDGYALR